MSEPLYKKFVMRKWDIVRNEVLCSVDEMDLIFRDLGERPALFTVISIDYLTHTTVKITLDVVKEQSNGSPYEQLED